MNILFVSLHFEENCFYYKIAQQIRKEGLDASFVSLSRKSAVDLKKYNENIIVLPDLLMKAQNTITLTEDAVSRIEQRYNLVNFRQIFLTDRGLKGKSEDYKALKTLSYFSVWEDLFNSCNIDVVITDVGGELIRRTVYIVAQKRNIPCIFMGWAPFNKELSLSMNEFYHIDGLPPNKVLNNEQEQIAENFIRAYKERACMFVFNPPLKLSLNRIKRFLNHLYISLFIEKCSHEHFCKIENAVTLGKRFLNKFLNKFLYSKPTPNDKYFYFPLHAYDDLQLTVRAPHCLDQAYLVNLFSDALPYGYKLYVKEHPGAIGNASFGMMKGMTAKSNVVLLSPDLNSHPIIKNARGVITINSTVGFEALLYSKPVISIGSSFYSNRGLTIDVNNFFDMPSAIRSALDFKVDRKKLCSLIFSAMETLYEGRPLCDISESNIEKVSKSVVLKLKEIAACSSIKP